VQHVDTRRTGALGHMTLRGKIAGADVTAHRNTREPERKLGRKRCESRLGARASGGAVGHDADLVAARGLRMRQIDHVTEQAADGRPQDVQDPEGSIGP
jgi:hypothetical protein